MNPHQPGRFCGAFLSVRCVREVFCVRGRLFGFPNIKLCYTIEYSFSDHECYLSPPCAIGCSSLERNATLCLCPHSWESLVYITLTAEKPEKEVNVVKVTKRLIQLIQFNTSQQPVMGQLLGAWCPKGSRCIGTFRSISEGTPRPKHCMCSGRI